MTPEQIWLVKLILAHLLADFVFQPKSWIADKNQKHFFSPLLYVHALITAVTAWIMIGWAYWPVALTIFLTHAIIDGWKSYRDRKFIWFALDQAMHAAILVVCWFFAFYAWGDVINLTNRLHMNPSFWIVTTALVFLTTPAGIIIGQLTHGWRQKLRYAETLANAGKWIGIIERLIVFILVVVGEYAAISLLIAAKGIIRFNEKDRPEVKTEYLVIGTLISIGLAMAVAFVVSQVISVA